MDYELNISLYSLRCINQLEQRMQLNKKLIWAQALSSTEGNITYDTYGSIINIFHNNLFLYISM